MSAATSTAPPGRAPARPAVPRRRGPRPARVVLHVALTLVAAAFLLPVAWAVFTSLRPYEETARKGYVSVPDTLTLDNYRTALQDGQLLPFFLNTVVIVVPALVVTLALASMAAFVLSRFSFRLNLPLLLLFTAGNLLPPQVIITPLVSIFRDVPLPGVLSSSGALFDSYWGVGLVHVGFQVGFCVFVLSSYMRTLPVELTEAARVDGAGVWRQYASVVLPLCRAPLAALATLQFTWMYNDFFWALVLMVTGDKRPITSALDNLRAGFFTDNNLVAAGAVLIALPTVVVFVVLQKQLVGGLTVGATKG